MHPHREVRAFGVRRADVGRVRVAGDRRLTRSDALSGAVAPLGANAWHLAIQFHELREIDIGTESSLDGFQIGSVAVAR